MPRSRSAGVVLCIVAGLSFLSPTPADASPAGLFDLPTVQVRYCGNGNYAFQGETNIVLPCPAVVQGFVEVIFDDLRLTLEGLADFPLAAAAELYVDTYIGSPLENVPFFGNGLSQLARVLVVVPFTVLEWSFDEFIFPVASLALAGVEALANVFAVVADRVLGALWMFAQYFAAWFGSAVYSIYSLIDFVGQTIRSAVSALATSIFGSFINFTSVATLFVTFQWVIDGFQSLASAAMQFVSSVTFDTQSDFGTVAMPGGTSVNVFGVAQTLPPALEAAMGILSGLVVVFAVIQALGFISKITESG